MKTKLFRSLKIRCRSLSDALRDSNFPLRYICLSARPVHSSLLGMEVGHLKYLINSSLILLFGLLHTADGVVTYLGLKFNLVDEANPMLVFFAGTMGLGLSIFLLKLLLLEFIAVLYFARRNMGSCWGTATLLSADAFYSWVVSNNIFLVAAA
ncbi:DUF5658 family protein [Methylomonas sp. MgM2]